MTPELSVAVGGDQETWVDVLPLAAAVMILDGQLEKKGSLISWRKKVN